MSWITTLVVIPKLNDNASHRVVECIDLIRSIAGELHVDVELYDANRAYVGDTTLFVACGGDGTMLSAMRLAANYDGYVLGINLGNVGFLTDLSAENQAVLRGNLLSILRDREYRIEPRLLARVTLADREFVAANEISISHIECDTVMQYQIVVNGMTAGTHRANSIMVATPTGSTAYSLAAGGALVFPASDVFQLVPVAPTVLTSRPIVVPADANVSLKVWSNAISVRVDGQTMLRECEGHTKEHPLVVNVAKYTRYAKVIHPLTWNYFDVLATKLGWIKG